MGKMVQSWLRIGFLKNGYGLRVTPLIPYTFDMKSPSTTNVPTLLKILPTYTGVSSLKEALNHPQAIRLLWLEILFNDQLDVNPWLAHQDVQSAFTKACSWYTAYRTLIHATIDRSPLPHQPNAIDPREYRVFAEALQFVARSSPHD
jgi:hypothetical protein